MVLIRFHLPEPVLKTLKFQENPSESPLYTLPGPIESMGQITALVEGNESILDF